MTRALFLALLLGVTEGGEASPPGVERLLEIANVSPTGDVSAAATPLAVRNGHVVLAQVEDDPVRQALGFLTTRVRLGKRGPTGVWEWSENTLETRTLHDAYHTQPSVAFDRQGHIHVAYNMHHMPWQYVVSATAYSIDAFEFRGENVTAQELETIRDKNKTNFPGPGRAAVPGNQITYPAFFTAPRGDLFLTYRYALKPARPWGRRSFATGIARYDPERRVWNSIGKEMQLDHGDAVDEIGESLHSNPFLFEERHVPYNVRIGFDGAGSLHAVWTSWDSRSGLDGSYTIAPSHSKLIESGFPSDISVRSAEREIGLWPQGTYFNTAKDLAVKSNGEVLAILEPRGAQRMLARLDPTTGRWQGPEALPFSASKILITPDGTEWTFASGIRVLRREAGSWRTYVRISENLCDPFPVYDEEENAFFVRARICPERRASVIYRIGMN